MLEKIIGGFEELKNFTVGTDINAKQFKRKNYIECPKYYANDIKMTSAFIIRLNKNFGNEELNKFIKVVKHIERYIEIYGFLGYEIDDKLIIIQEFVTYGLVDNQKDDDGNGILALNVDFRIKEEELCQK